MQIRSPDVQVAGALPQTAAAHPVVTSRPPVKAPDHESVLAAVKAANDAVKAMSNSVEFTVDLQSGRAIVRIVDTDTQQLIRQFPSEEMLAISRALDRLQGLLITSQA